MAKTSLSQKSHLYTPGDLGPAVRSGDRDAGGHNRDDLSIISLSHRLKRIPHLR